MDISFNTPIFDVHVNFSFALIILNVSCSGTESFYGRPRSNSQFYISCPPHMIYCYKKSDLICRKDYRVLTVNMGNNPEMIVECK